MRVERILTGRSRFFAADQWPLQIAIQKCDSPREVVRMSP